MTIPGLKRTGINLFTKDLGTGIASPLLMRFLFLIFVSFYASLSGASSLEPSIKVCETTLLEKSQVLKWGRIENFDLKVVPKFSLSRLKAEQDQLTPRNPKYILGETGASIWHIESRILAGATAPEIVAVKYFKREDVMELQQTLRVQARVYDVFKTLDLLPLFDILMPLEVGFDYIVYPFVEGVALRNLTLDSLRHLNPPEDFLNPNIFGLGPPLVEQDPALAHVWAVQQKRLKAAIKAFKGAGYSVVDRVRERSWSGVPYLAYYDVETGERGKNFPMRDDVIVTTDGRFVIVDPY